MCDQLRLHVIINFHAIVNLPIIMRRTALLQSENNNSQVGLKSRNPQSSEVQIKKGQEFPSKCLKYYILCSIVLTLCLLYIPITEFDSDTIKIVDVINRLEPTTVIQIQNAVNNTELESQTRIAGHKDEQENIVDKQNESKFDAE